MVICELCSNMDCEKDGIGCMVRSRKRALDGKRCGDFAPNEFFYCCFSEIVKNGF